MTPLQEAEDGGGTHDTSAQSPPGRRQGCGNLNCSHKAHIHQGKEPLDHCECMPSCMLGCYTAGCPHLFFSASMFSKWAKSRKRRMTSLVGRLY